MTEDLPEAIPLSSSLLGLNKEAPYRVRQEKTIQLENVCSSVMVVRI